MGRDSQARALPEMWVAGYVSVRLGPTHHGDMLDVRVFLDAEAKDTAEECTMTDPNLAHARAWIEPTLRKWCEGWDLTSWDEFGNDLAAVLGAAVEAKGKIDAGREDTSRSVWVVYDEEVEGVVDMARTILAHAADVPEVPSV